MTVEMFLIIQKLFKQCKCIQSKISEKLVTHRTTENCKDLEIDKMSLILSPDDENIKQLSYFWGTE